MRTYGTNLPNSLTPVAPDGPCLSPAEHLCRISVRSLLSSFHGLWVRPTCAISGFGRFLPLRLPRRYLIRPGESPVRLSPKRRLSVSSGAGMLTSFPVVSVELRRDLGSTNPRLIDSAEEPLLVRPSGVTPDSRCYYDQDYPHRPVHTNSRPCFRPNGVPAYAIVL